MSAGLAFLLLVREVLCGSMFPGCVLKDEVPRQSTPVLMDVRPYIGHLDAVRHRLITFTSHPQLGLVLSGDPHDLGEYVAGVLPNSQGEGAGVRPGWIVTEVDGKPFSKTERLNDVYEDFMHARVAGNTMTVKFDVRSSIDCTAGRCDMSDRFPTDSMTTCAEACKQSGACEWWYMRTDDGDTMCGLSKDVIGYANVPGSASGAHDCGPDSVATYPSCVTQGYIPPEAGAVYADLSSLTSEGAGCANGDCSASDQFFVSSQDACTTACDAIAGCRFWTITQQGGRLVCAFRSTDGSRLMRMGSVSGSRTCKVVADDGGFLWSLRWVLIAAIVVWYLFTHGLRLPDGLLDMVQTVLSSLPSFSSISMSLPRSLASSLPHRRFSTDMPTSELGDLGGFGSDHGRKRAYMPAGPSYGVL